MRVAIVSEYYPRAHDPVLGIWAHRQALAARDAGADVRVLVLHRPIPPLSTPPRDIARETRRLLVQPHRAALDGIEVEYAPFVAPPRPGHYGSWGAWAAPSVALALRRLRRRFPFELLHAHNAVPAADAVLRARIGAPLVVSVHGSDVFHTARRFDDGRAAVARAFGAARLVLANSAGVEAASRALGARHTRVVHLGTDLPPAPADAAGREPPVLVTIAHLIARKRHADVLRAIALRGDRRPALRYLVIGDGPERDALERLAGELGLRARVEFAGQLAPAVALRRAREASVFVMPSVDEAFGVAYVEAMAAGLPAIGARGEPGPEEIAAAGRGIRLVPAGDIDALAREIDALVGNRAALRAAGADARSTVAAAFTWERCGRATVRAYEDALR
ncbi:MAG: teichuronic acid biosynthesis glycosyltransferase TuaC [Solirubrobacteraceae bacterium]|nr:teichuronic acid biosynthesis glycosyltransferase TuaC [Solirubrobacteraceae bacterium]